MSVRRGHKHSVRDAAIAALLATLVAVFASSTAMAHAVLVASDPADGAVLEVSPGRLTLMFNEPVSPLVVRLLGPGSAKQKIAVAQDGSTLAITPGEGLPEGTHLLSWRVMSADGHPVGGTVTFSIGRASKLLPSMPSVDAAVGVAAWAARIAIYVALFVGVGGTLFVFWFGSGALYAVERVLYAALAAGLIAAPLSIGLHGADLLGVSLLQLGEPAVWRAGVLSPYIATVGFVFLAVFSAQLAFAARSRRKARIAATIAFVFVGVALAASGHASVAPPQWLTRPAVFVHALAIAFWIGALLPLAGLLLARPRDAREVLRGFSRTAPSAVAALILSGAVLAFVQLGNLSALWQTDYGRLLLVKFGLLSILFSVALYNRLVLTGRMAAGESAAGRALARSIAVEIVLALAIFAVAASWRFTPPPRALAAVAATPVAIHMRSVQAMADLRFDPGRVGPTAASILLMTGDFGPLDAKEVLLVLSNESAGIEPIRRSARRGDDGIWRVTGLMIPASGRWTARIDILVTDFEKIVLEETVEFHR